MNYAPAMLPSEVATTQMDTEEECKLDDDGAPMELPLHPMVALLGKKRKREHSFNSLLPEDSPDSGTPNKGQRRGRFEND
jgi:hypothetical protein